MVFVVSVDIAKVEKVDGTLLTGGGYATPLIVETSVILEILAVGDLKEPKVVVPLIVRLDPIKLDAVIVLVAVIPPKTFVVLRLVIQLSFALSVPNLKV